MQHIWATRLICLIISTVFCAHCLQSLRALWSCSHQRNNRYIRATCLTSLNIRRFHVHVSDDVLMGQSTDEGHNLWEQVSRGVVIVFQPRAGTPFSLSLRTPNPYSPRTSIGLPSHPRSPRTSIVLSPHPYSPRTSVGPSTIPKAIQRFNMSSPTTA